MSTTISRGRIAIVALAAALACLLSAILAKPAMADGNSTVCQAAGLPSTTQTVAVPGVFHVTAFTCANAVASGFQQCPKQTVAVPDVVRATVYYCVPLQIGVSFGPTGESFSVTGVGGVSAGTG